MARFRSERVHGVGGGTVLVGENIMQATYWRSSRGARADLAGCDAQSITLAALVFGMAAGVAVSLGWFGLACLLATASTISDILDGQVARVTRTGSNTGELLDAVVDRLQPSSRSFAGFILYARSSRSRSALHSRAARSFMISYTSAKPSVHGLVRAASAMPTSTAELRA